MVSMLPPERVKLQRIRSFYKYLTNKVHLTQVKIRCKDLDSPKLKKTLPKYLDLGRKRAAAGLGGRSRTASGITAS